MEKHIKEILKNQSQQEMSPKEVLASFNHIELTEDEYCLAMIEAKRKKEAILKERERAIRAEKTRRQLTEVGWSYEQTKAFMLYRAKTLFEGKFILDENNEAVFDLLCHYFSDSNDFISIAMNMGVNNPSLNKGILLAGNYGVGKTWLMSLFRKNNKRVYHVVHAKELAAAYKKNGDEAIEPHLHKIKNAFNDPVVFFQEYSGLCIEDVGSEDPKGHYGDKPLVVGDIIEGRYVNECLTGWFHGTTNLTAKEIGDYYTPRVTSRLRESVNLIELGGPDRRK